MYLLAELIPRLRRWRAPATRDQCFLALAALNLIFLGIDIYLAHSISGTIKPNEWLPIGFGMAAGIALMAAGLLASGNRKLAMILANLVFLSSIVVGALGAYFHLDRTVLLRSGLFGSEAVSTLIWAPPVIGPMFFILVSILGITAAWVESPADSGRLKLLGERSVQMPYSKTRAYMLITAIFILATLISSVLDHARVRFDNAWTWLPVTAALFGMATCLYLGIMRAPSAGDIMAHASAMVVLMAVGALGFALHADSNLTAAGQINSERFLRGSPFLAPLLFCNVGLMGLLALMDPREG